MHTLVAPVIVDDSALTDDHSLLLWQTCAYADDLTDAVRAGRSLTASHHAPLEFLYDRLLPYLTDEERRLPSGRLRDDHLVTLIGAEHARLRADVRNIQDSRTRDLLAIATERLVDRLERHVHREEAWLTSSEALRIPLNGPGGATPRGSAWV